MTAITTYARPTAVAVKNLSFGLAERGKIKIGQKGQTRRSAKGNEFQPPEKLDHFIITTNQRGADGNLLPDEPLMAKLRGNAEKLTRIPVRLFFDEATLNLATRYVAYGGKSVWCQGDGETATRNGKSRPCPCPNLEAGYTPSADTGPACKINGRLHVLIDGADTVGGAWVFRTTSWNSIRGLIGAMMFIQAASGGKLAGLPLNLMIEPKTAKKPDGNPVTIYVVGLEYRGSLEKLRDVAYQTSLQEAQHTERLAYVHEQARLLLAAPIAGGEDDDDVVDEFYPEQAMAAAGAKPATGNGGDLKSRLLAQAKGEPATASVKYVDLFGAEMECAPADLERLLIEEAEASGVAQDLEDFAQNNSGHLMMHPAVAEAVERQREKLGASDAPEPVPAPEPPPANNTTRKLVLYDSDGQPATEYDTAGEWLEGLRMVADVEGVLDNNWSLLTKIATSPKTPADLRERAEKLRERATQPDLVGDDA